MFLILPISSSVYFFNWKALVKNYLNTFKAFKERLLKKSFSFSILFLLWKLILSTLFMSLNAFSRLLSQLKIIWIISFWRLYHLRGFITKLRDGNLLFIAFLLLKLFKFRYIFCLLLFVKGSYSFHFYSLHMYFYIFSCLFYFSTALIYSRWG